VEPLHVVGVHTEGAAVHYCCELLAESAAWLL
jgi:hypothetical protein